MAKSPRKIIARYPGVCSSCGDAIAVGASIWWSPGKAYHVADVTPACKAKVLARVMATIAADDAAKAAAAAKVAAAPAPDYDGMCPDSGYAAAYNAGHGLCPDGCCGTFVPCTVAACCG